MFLFLFYLYKLILAFLFLGNSQVMGPHLRGQTCYVCFNHGEVIMVSEKGVYFIDQVGFVVEYILKLTKVCG